MDHTEVMMKMITERYLLNELPPEEREAFEEHLFDCPDCVLDLRAGAALIEEAKVLLKSPLLEQMPTPAAVAAIAASSRGGRQSATWESWLSWFRPVYAAPAFVTLLLILGYQNLVTYPGLRAAAEQPQLLPWTPLHGATRGSAGLVLTADRAHGIALPVDLPPQPSAGAYSSYDFDLYGPQGKLVWAGLVHPAAGNAENGDDLRVLLVIPGAALRDGSYTVTVSGVAAQGERTEIDKYVFRLHLTD